MIQVVALWRSLVPNVLIFNFTGQGKAEEEGAGAAALRWTSSLASRL